MRQERLLIEGIPAIIYGEKSTKAFLFVHGQGGNKEEAQGFAEIVSGNGWQVVSIDLPEHGDRENEADRFFPWFVVPELQSVWGHLGFLWDEIALRADSIGAWYSLLAFQDRAIARSLFVSPVLDMKQLIINMMQSAGVTREELAAKQTIPTSFGPTLSWKYLLYAEQHPILRWDGDIKVLYGAKDNLTERHTVDKFVEQFHGSLTVMENGEHWFHAEDQLAVLSSWVRQSS